MPTGDQYSGNWHKDQKHGYGQYVWSDGDVYEGNWENDMRNNEVVLAACFYSLLHIFSACVWVCAACSCLHIFVDVCVYVCMYV